MRHKCPVCQKTTRALAQQQSEEASFFPFCSQRCKLIDLGAWLDGEYRILSGPQSEESGEPAATSPISSDK